MLYLKQSEAAAAALPVVRIHDSISAHQHHITELYILTS